VDVAGFGTEQLRGLLDHTTYCLHGGVDEIKLNELIKSAGAVLVHQKAAVGTLTRIPEMLLAGVPVIANSIAARNHVRLDGVHIYETPEELFELLKRPLAEPALPERPARAEQRLGEVLRQWIYARRKSPPG
jgi:hypothetical protein